MSPRKKYKKRTSTYVTAVKLDLDTEGFVYRKWGGVQTCKPGDWLVNNQGDTYTIDAQTFADTYEETSPGVYTKTSEVWAEVADSDGVIKTLEGETRYQAGDYLVYNDDGGKDGYAISHDKFESLYEPC